MSNQETQTQTQTGINVTSENLAIKASHDLIEDLSLDRFKQYNKSNKIYTLPSLMTPSEDKLQEHEKRNEETHRTLKMARRAYLYAFLGPDKEIKPSLEDSFFEQVNINGGVMSSKYEIYSDKLGAKIVFDIRPAKNEQTTMINMKLIYDLEPETGVYANTDF